MDPQEIYFALVLFPVFSLFFYAGFYNFSFLLRIKIPFVRRTKKTCLKIEKFFSYFFMVTELLAALYSFLLSTWMGCSTSLAICTAAFIHLLMVRKEEKTV